MDWNDLSRGTTHNYISRSPCGFVDWNIIRHKQEKSKMSRSPCGFVDWNCVIIIWSAIALVEALAASWIEMDEIIGRCKNGKVEALAASWIEILQATLALWEARVEALAASWIEIFLVIETPYHMFVEALAASWIEIGNGIYDWIPYRSKPLRLRGLKYVRPLKSLFQQCRSPCGFVDWNKFAPGEIQGFFCISPAVLWVENKIQNIVKKSLFCGRMIIKG